MTNTRDHQQDGGRRLVLLDIPTHATYQRRIVEGVMRHAQRAGADWTFAFRTRPDFNPMHLARNMGRLAGILAQPQGQHIGALYRYARRWRIPMVIIEGDEQRPGAGYVGCDNDAIGGLALEHFHAKGYRDVSFLSLWRVEPFIRREAAFAAAAEQAGLNYHPQPTMGLSEDWLPLQSALADYVDALPTPVGIFCGNEEAAYQLAVACRQSGRAVPEDVGLLGCDNDELFCDMTRPPLSSIDHGMLEVGRRAAGLLHEMMQGASPPDEPIHVPPIGVVERQSSDTLAVEDDNIRRALRLIRARALEGLTPAQVVKHVPIARRKLEMGFREHLGCTIYEQILRHRMDHACKLLRETDLPLDQIAAQCGYANASRLHEAFGKAVGATPGQYRKDNR
jgi:LacI family transcriptional regulator